MSLKPFAPFPKARDRAGWAAIASELSGALVREGERYLGYSFPAITATDWLLFTETGDRSTFEAKYFVRRKGLSALVLAECAEYNGRFLSDIANLIFLICEESGWQLPAHNSYVRNTPCLPLPDTTRPVLDLFAAETGGILAAAYYLVGDEVERAAQGLSARIRAELSRRVMTPFLHEHFWWMGERGPTNNWTVWCTQNILYTAFLCDFEELERQQAAEKSQRCIDAFLSDYGEDGCCDEGAQYFRRAGLSMADALAVLDAVGIEAAQDYWNREKVRNIARYILNVHVDGEYYINFADCSVKASYPGPREYLFGKRIGDESLCDFAAWGWRRTAEKQLPEEHSLFDRALAAFCDSELAARAATEPLHESIYYKSTGLWIHRSGTFCVGVKAGDNDDSHNHNDVGSVTVFKNGQPLLIDVGVGTYSRKTFSPQRYEIWTMQSSYHNLPDFDGIMQSQGEKFAAQDVILTENSIHMQLKNAWTEEAKLESFVRAVTVTDGGVIIEDKCAGGYAKSVMNLMFAQKPEGLFTAEGAQSQSVEQIAIDDARLRAAWPDMLYRVRLVFDGKLRVTIGSD